jgi:predicted ATP-dependent endonuclease of OLD family
MRVTRIEIENFRSIRYLVVDLGETTVFVGPNNAGKTAILDALRIALTRAGVSGAPVSASTTSTLPTMRPIRKPPAA